MPWLVIALAAVVLTGGCSKSSPSSSSGETHWLLACADDSACGDAEGAVCRCGVCTRECSEASACTGAGALTACAPVGSAALDALCPSAPSSGLCLPPCSGASDCAAAGSGLGCVDGQCVPGGGGDAGTTDGGGAADAGSADGGPAIDGGGGALTWYTTCGDPVCGMGHRDAGLPTCTSAMQEGGACTDDGTQCDPIDDCNAHLVCATMDPKMQPGGCPISRRRFKDDIRYLDPTDIQAEHDQLMSMPLATYRYKQGDRRTHLGFIIEDVEPSPAVDGRRDQVDLYGYTTMAVASLKVQNARIEALEAEVAALRAELEARGDGPASMSCSAANATVPGRP